MQVPSLSSPGYSVWILISRGHGRFVNEIHRHNSDIVNYSSSLRAKECNLNDVCLEYSKPAVVNHGQGSQDSNNVKTKVEPTSMHRETVASTMRETQPPRKAAAAAAAIAKEDRIWTTIPGCPKCKRDSFETRISKCVAQKVRHHDQDERETDGAMHWDVILPVLKG